uniref:Uncharacterized protein n=1 Tax=Cannabis sativa TaxID=3483 RepID=A0A803QTB8_CANSA
MQEVRCNSLDTRSDCCKRIIWQWSPYHLRQSPDNLPIISGITYCWDRRQCLLSATFSIFICTLLLAECRCWQNYICTIHTPIPMMSLINHKGISGNLIQVHIISTHQIHKFGSLEAVYRLWHKTQVKCCSLGSTEKQNIETIPIRSDNFCIICYGFNS